MLIAVVVWEWRIGENDRGENYRGDIGLSVINAVNFGETMGLKEAPLPFERWYSEEGGVPSFLAIRLQGLAFDRNRLSLW